MKVLVGLFDHMVIQRNTKNVSEAFFSGMSDLSGNLFATVYKGRQVLRGFEQYKAGQAGEGIFSGTLKGVPAGGPYRVDLTLGDARCVIRDILVGDVWLLAGQSNMGGAGLSTTAAEMKPDRLVRAFYMDDSWRVAQDPIHQMWDCVDEVHVFLNGGARPGKPEIPKNGIGPGPMFGRDMKRRSGVPQGLIACAHGGTGMVTWDPASRDEGGRSLYGAMLRRFVKNGSKVAGLVWYQGCNETNQWDTLNYTLRMQRFAAAVRRDLGDADLPVVMVQVARVVGFSPESVPHWNGVREQQRLLPRTIPNLTVVPAIDLPLDDLIHLSGAGQLRLGRRLAEAAHVLRKGGKAGLPPIELASITPATIGNAGALVVEYKNVVGGLRAAGRPLGFWYEAADGLAKVFDVALDGNRAIVRTTLSESQLNAGALYYGFGLDPVCNITDEADRSLPAFGPFDIGATSAFMPFISTLRVSKFMPWTSDFKSLQIPCMTAVQLKRREFPEVFCNLHAEIEKQGTEEATVYFACKFRCPEAMHLRLHLGYDGPVKAWADGLAVACDPTGINPAVPSKQKISLATRKGLHEVVVALGTRKGATWGLYMQLERPGLTRKALDTGSYLMPEVVG
ncbi:MAG: sialate O-acetylesterase [bacterium]